MSLQDEAIDAIRLFEAKSAERDAKPARRRWLVWHFAPGISCASRKGRSPASMRSSSAVDHRDRVRALVSLFSDRRRPISPLSTWRR